MKKERFLELINLHLDHEISASESAELESEVHVNAEFRKIYNQYLRLHEGTMRVFETYREEAPASPRFVRESDRRPALASAGWWLPVGITGTAAAAAFAVVLTRFSEPSLIDGRAQGAGLAAETARPLPAVVAPVDSPRFDLVNFNSNPESLAIHQQVKFRPIDKVQNQPFVFSPEWRRQQKDGALAPAAQQQAEEMTALQFKR